MTPLNMRLLSGLPLHSHKQFTVLQTEAKSVRKLNPLARLWHTRTHSIVDLRKTGSVHISSRIREGSSGAISLKGAIVIVNGCWRRQWWQWQGSRAVS